MTKRTENLDEQIQALEDEIADLQRRWMPYKMVQPMLPGQPTGMGPYDPTRFLEKSKISIAIDRKQIELADLQRRRAEQALVAFEDAGGLTDAESAYRDAQTTYEEAKRALAAAEMAFHQTRGTLLLQRERHTHLTKAIARCQASERRWSDELEGSRDGRVRRYSHSWMGGVAMAGLRPTKFTNQPADLDVERYSIMSTNDSLERRLGRLVELYSAQGCSTCRHTSVRLVHLYDDHIDETRPEFCSDCGKAADQTLIINLRTDDDDDDEGMLA